MIDNTLRAPPFPGALPPREVSGRIRGALLRMLGNETGKHLSIL
jgi:hypothetical protein